MAFKNRHKRFGKYKKEFYQGTTGKLEGLGAQGLDNAFIDENLAQDIVPTFSKGFVGAPDLLNSDEEEYKLLEEKFAEVPNLEEVDQSEDEAKPSVSKVTPKPEVTAFE